MKLTGNQSFFELHLLDYRPAADDLPVASQSMAIAIRSGWQRHRSVAMGAQIPADEIETLIEWLRQASQPRTAQPRLLFRHTNLAFDCLTTDADECLMQVRLGDDLAPAWQENPLLPFWIPVLTTRLGIQQAADELSGQFRQLIGIV